MDGDVTFSYRGSWCAEGMNTPWHGEWRIVGEKGSVLWNGGWNGDDGDFRAEVALPGTGGLQRDRQPVPMPTGDFTTQGHGHKSIIDGFVTSVRGGDHLPETICTDNIHSLAMVFAAIDSAGRGARVIL